MLEVDAELHQQGRLVFVVLLVLNEDGTPHPPDAPASDAARTGPRIRRGATRYPVRLEQHVANRRSLRCGASSFFSSIRPVHIFSCFLLWIRCIESRLRKQKQKQKLSKHLPLSTVQGISCLYSKIMQERPTVTITNYYSGVIYSVCIQRTTASELFLFLSKLFLVESRSMI